MNKGYPTALLLVANGSEDLEVVTISDILRRTSINLKIISVENSTVIKFSKGLKIIADHKISETIPEPDAIIIPGGFVGVETIRKNKIAMSLLQNHVQSRDKLFATICAGSLVFLDLVLKENEVKITSWPSLKHDFSSSDNLSWINKSVVVDGRFITAQGPSSAITFGVKIAEKMLDDSSVIDKLKKGLLFD